MAGALKRPRDGWPIAWRCAGAVACTFAACPMIPPCCGSAHTIQPETLHALLARAAQLAAHLRVTPAQKLWVDGTVVETTIHSPTDSRLLGDGVRVLTRLGKPARPLVAERLGGVRDAFRRRTRSMQRTLQALYRHVRHRSE